MNRGDGSNQAHGTNSGKYYQAYPSRKKKDLARVESLRKKIVEKVGLSDAEKEELLKLSTLLGSELTAVEMKQVTLKTKKGSWYGRKRNISIALVTLVVILAGVSGALAYSQQRSVIVSKSKPTRPTPNPVEAQTPQEGAKDSPAPAGTSSASPNTSANSAAASSQAYQQKTNELNQLNKCSAIRQSKYATYSSIRDSQYNLLQFETANAKQNKDLGWISDEEYRTRVNATYSKYNSEVKGAWESYMEPSSWSDCPIQGINQPSYYPPI